MQVSSLASCIPMIFIGSPLWSYWATCGEPPERLPLFLFHRHHKKRDIRLLLVPTSVHHNPRVGSHRVRFFCFGFLVSVHGSAAFPLYRVSLAAGKLKVLEGC